MSVVLDCTGAPFVRWRKKQKLSSDGGNSDNKNANEAMMGSMVGCGRLLESGGRFCVGASGTNLASVPLNMFSRLIYFIKNCYKTVLSMSFKNNAAKSLV
jgi:hypothetical protein